MPRATKALLLKRGGKAPKSINEPISNTPPMTVADKGRNNEKVPPSHQSAVADERGI